MSSPPTAVVTAQGVRDGDRMALTALVERRGAAVLAYCAAVAEPARGLEAAGEALARFRREVRAAAEPRALDPEVLLLRATRRAAAARAPKPEEPRGLVARRLGATCPLVPELLAVRADGNLTAADRLRLTRHLERCEGCREAEERFTAGERAYHEVPDEPPAPEAAGGLLAALRTAAPNADERLTPAPAPAPAPAATAAPARPAAAPAEEEEGTEELEAEPVAAGAAASPTAPAVEPPPPRNGARAAAGPPTLSWDPADVAAAAAAPPRERNWRRLGARIAVPAVILTAAVVTALAVAGAFTGGEKSNSGSVETESVVPTPTVRVLQRPTTTPLPDSRAAPASSTEPSRTTAAAPSSALASAHPASDPAASTPDQSVPASAPVSAPPAQPRRSKAADRLDARATGGTEAKPPSTGGTEAADGEAGFQPQP